MRLCNEYGTAFKNVTDPGSISHLLAAGWREVREEPVKMEEAPQTVTEEAPAEVPEILEPSALKYKDQYLSWYVQAGNIAQLRDVLNHLGIPFEKTAKKKDLQAILRGYLKGLKQELKGGAVRDRK